MHVHTGDLESLARRRYRTEFAGMRAGGAEPVGHVLAFPDELLDGAVEVREGLAPEPHGLLERGRPGWQVEPAGVHHVVGRERFLDERGVALVQSSLGNLADEIHVVLHGHRLPRLDTSGESTRSWPTLSRAVPAVMSRLSRPAGDL